MFKQICCQRRLETERSEVADVVDVVCEMRTVSRCVNGGLVVSLAGDI